jgi:hypothetical protein
MGHGVKVGGTYSRGVAARVSPSLHEFRRVQRIIDVAALQLHPPNFDRIAALVELGSLARKAADGSLHPGVRLWKRWMNSDEAAKILAISPNGIVDRPGVEAVAVSGRGVGLIPGRARDEAIAARLLGFALDTTLARHGNDEALQRASRELRAGLALGDAMVERAGLPHALWPQHVKGRIVLPDAKTLDRLRHAVTFARSDLPLDGETFGSLMASSEFPTPDDLWRMPLIPHDGIVITQPFAVSSATVAQAWATATTSRHAHEVRAAIRARWAEELDELLGLCDWRSRPRGNSEVLEVELDNGTIGAILLLVEEAPDAARVWDASDATRRALAALDSKPDSERIFVIAASLSFGRAPIMSVGEDIPAGHAWTLDAHGLQYLLEASRLDPLALVRAHRRLPPKLPPGAAVELLDVFGAVRYMEDTGEVVTSDGDPTEIAIKIARLNAQRHPAPRWDDGGRDVEVTRFRYSNDDRLFAPAVPDGHTRVLVRDGLEVCWVGSAAPTPSRFAAEAVLTEMTAFWTARLAAARLLGDSSTEGWTSIVVAFDPTAADDEPLVAGFAGRWLLLRFGPEFIRIAAAGDNTADRLTVVALAGMTHSSEPEKGRLFGLQAADAVAPKGPGTFVIWNDPGRYELPAPPSDLIRTSTAARLMAGIEIADALRAAGSSGLASGTVAKDWIDSAVVAGLDLLDQEVCECTPTLLCELVRLTGIAAEEAERRGVNHAAHDALGALPSGVELHEEHLIEPARARVALRFLVELVHARRPSGGARVNEERLQRLRAIAESVIELASASDFAHSRLLTLTVLLPPSGPLALSGTGTGREARTRQADLVLDRAPTASLELHPEWWDADRPASPPRVDRPLELGPEWSAVSDAMRDEMDFGWDDLLRVARSLADAAIASGDALQQPRDTVAVTASRVTGLGISTCEAVIRFLSLERPDPYDPRKHPYKPWKTGRDTGYLRRPLLAVGDNELLWSGPHMLVSMAELTKRLELRRLKLPGDRVRKALDKLRAAGDREWERALASLISELGLTDVRARVEEIGGRRVAREDGSTLGDLDVLVLHERTHTVWALDAKRLAPATAAMALPNEADHLAREARKLELRLRWLDANIDAVASEFGLASRALASWSVRGAIVIATPLGGAFIAESPVPVLTWEELRLLLSSSM